MKAESEIKGKYKIAVEKQSQKNACYPTLSITDSLVIQVLEWEA